MGLGKTVQTIALLLHTYSGSHDGREQLFPTCLFNQTGSTVSAKSNNSAKSNDNIAHGNNGPRQLSLFDDFVHEGSSEVDEGSNGTDESSSGTDEDSGKTLGNVMPIPTTLIVMPTSLIHNWVNEFNKFAPSLKLYVHAGVQRSKFNEFAKAIEGKQIILTTYGTARQDIGFLCHFSFHYLILDESQYIKNQSSLTFNSVKQLHSSYKLSLTGTPVENSLTDLWTQMDFLNEGILGKHSQFRSRYQETKVMADDKKQKKLLKIIQPFILRRTKEAVAPELPPLVEETVYCEMGEEQSRLYAEVKSSIRNILMDKDEDDERSVAAIALTGLTRLRQLANHPSLYINDYQGEAAKFDQIIEQAEVLFSENHKVLIFSSFVKHLRLVADSFEERGWRYAWLTGSTVNREGEIERFNSDKSVQAFFISLKAGGTGLNLTAADYVFIIDPWWNPAAEMQAVSRAHRIGQDKKVTLYRFITKDTIEEKIQRLQRYKKELTDMVIHPRLSIEEIQTLLE